jgi:hypothetical protein
MAVGLKLVKTGESVESNKPGLSHARQNHGIPAANLSNKVALWREFCRCGVTGKYEQA